MATQAMDLDKDAFMHLVTEEHLDVKGPSAGYLYAGRREKDGWVVYRTPNNPWYYHQVRRVATCANAGGGTLILTVTVPAGVILKNLRYAAVGPATNTTLNVFIHNEDGALTSNLDAVAAGVSRQALGPKGGTLTTTTPTLHSSMIACEDMVLGPGERLVVEAAASANTETLTLGFTCLLSQPTIPTWAASGTGTPTLAASTVSAANSLTLVAMP